jgi:hypothetical protein
VKVQLPEYGLPGFAVIKGIPYIHPVPDPFGKLCMLGVSTSLFEHDFKPAVFSDKNPTTVITPAALTEAGIETFRRAVNQYNKEHLALTSDHGVLISLLLAQLSANVYSIVISDPVCISAQMDLDSFRLYMSILSICGQNTASARIHELDKYVTSVQGSSSLPKYVEALHIAEYSAFPIFLVHVIVANGSVLYHFQISLCL